MWQGLTKTEDWLLFLLVIPRIELKVLIFYINQLLLLLLEPLGIIRPRCLVCVASFHG